MSTFAASLRNEIVRLSKRTARQLTQPMRRTISTQRRHLAALKKQLVAVEKELDLLKLTRKSADEAPSPDGLRFRAQGLKTLRSRLQLGAEAFGKLVGVSGQTVYNWESKKSTPDKNNLAAIARVRGFGKRQAAAHLQALANQTSRKRSAR